MQCPVAATRRRFSRCTPTGQGPPKLASEPRAGPASGRSAAAFLCLTMPLARPYTARTRRPGAVAQLGERCNRTAEVRSSILLGSTN